MRVAILGLSITSAWGNGHATNYRALARALQRRGDHVVFLERDQPWYAQNRDLPAPPWCDTHLYGSIPELRRCHTSAVRQADLVIVGSFVPEGVEVARWVLDAAPGAVAFYDIDTPVTIEKLRAADDEYLTAELVERFDLYLSFTAGPALDVLHEEFGARRPEPFFCFVDPDAYAPVEAAVKWGLTYLGTYSAGRQPTVDELLVRPARARPDECFAVAGPMYPPEIVWPPNVARIEHLPPADHACFYSATRFTLNVTRPEMRALGYSPSVRLFEAGACGAAIVSDSWPGLDTVFVPGKEVLLADTCVDVLRLLDAVSEEQRRAIGAAARRRVHAEHTADRRVEQLHELISFPIHPVPTS
jgi:spore maturation protein CgeB